MNQSILFSICVSAFLVTACGGSSSSSPVDDGTSAGATSGSTTSGTTSGSIGGGTTAGTTGMLSDVAGVWDISRSGTEPRSEYWDIKADGTFNAYVFRDFKNAFLPDSQENLEIFRCFEKQENTLSSVGGGVYTVEGLFRDERQGSTFELNPNANGTLQAKYVSDLVACSANGCFTETLDEAYPRVAADFNPEELFICPATVAPVSLLVTSETEIDTNIYWECTFANQDDRTAELATANVSISGAGTGIVAVNGNNRDFVWFTRSDSDLEADYIDGSGTFALKDLIFYSNNEPNDRFTALDISTRIQADTGTPSTTYFEMDCSLVKP